MMHIFRRSIKDAFICSIITLLTMFVNLAYATEPEIKYQADFESGTIEGWRCASGDKDTVLSVSDCTPSQDSKFSIRVDGNGRNIGMARSGLNVKATPNTYLEFDWRSDCQDRLRYIAFALNLKDYPGILWLWCNKENAIGNPVRGVWHHARIPLSEFKDINRMKTVEEGDIVTRLFIHQLQPSGMPHSFAIDNVKIIAGEASEFTSPSVWTNGK